MPLKKRPLSPHLQVYNPQITSVMSILHRISGVILALGSLFLLWILVSLSMGEQSFATTSVFLASPIAKLALMGYTACLMYHLFNGIRHLFWDIGKGFDIPTVYRSGYAVIVLSLLSTAVIWWLATSSGGVP
jgi:succinate dehydrogenase / fumarate reductase cytochrome b subunit